MVARDAVEELQAEGSRKPQGTEETPFEIYYDHNPDAVECRTYKNFLTRNLANDDHRNTNRDPSYSSKCNSLPQLSRVPALSHQRCAAVGVLKRAL